MNTCFVDQPRIIDARRTSGAAGKAGKTTIDMQNRLSRRRDTRFEHLLHHDDAPARTIALVAEQHVCWTSRGADSAMHAGAQILFRLGKMRIGKLGWRESGTHHTPSHILPGLKRPSGSNAAFTARVSCARTGSSCSNTSASARVASVARTSS